MKKVVVFLLASLLVFTLVGCSGNKLESIKKEFEEEGFTVATVDTSNTIVKTALGSILTDEQMSDLANYELILCTKLVSNAIIVKFKSENEIKDFLTVEDDEGNKDTSMYNKIKDNDQINGNFLLIYGDSNAKDIFN